jgi:hypothetical protein
MEMQVRARNKALDSTIPVTFISPADHGTGPRLQTPKTNIAAFDEKAGTDSTLSAWQLNLARHATKPTASVAAAAKAAEPEPGHELGNVTGTGIEMKVADHAIGGVINGGIVFGVFDESIGAAQLTMRKYGETIRAEFKKQADNTLGGTIVSGEGDKVRRTSVTFLGLDAPSKTMKLKIGEEEIAVTMTPEGVNSGHFVNPTFTTTIGGKEVKYRIEVECCYGYAINRAMMIPGAYAH